MEPETETQTSTGDGICPNCGAHEDGFFCRNCGALLRGEDMVLCPRCHQIVPGDRFCNQCGQELTGIALSLKQLALAGDAFWMTAEAAAPAGEPTPDLDSEAIEPAQESGQDLEKGTIPDWLRELSTAPPPADVGVRIYPALQPVGEAATGERTTRVLGLVILLLGILFLALLIAAAILLLHGPA